MCYDFRMVEPDIETVFMPEGQCARCNQAPPHIYVSFKNNSGQTTLLGFCSELCEFKFENGIKALREGV